MQLAGFHDHDSTEDRFLVDVLAGLRARPRTLPSKYFYDEIGSQLFDRISDLDEYYPTRTEVALLEDCAAEIAALAGPDVALIEFGSGAARKVRIVLDALDRPAAYVPVDISREFLKGEAEAVAGDYPGLPVHPVAADFSRPFTLPSAIAGRRRLGLFPGSTIGNVPPSEAVGLMQAFRADLGPDSLLVIGADRDKDPAILTAAYNDRQGVTAAFNLNLLARINRELGGDFDPAAFRHEARYDTTLKRIEMHLVSRRDQTVTVADTRFDFVAGESILTEISHKYDMDGFAALAAAAGWAPAAAWTDADGLFAIHCLTPAA